MTMDKKIRNEQLKMTAMMLVLVGLGIYAHEFVLSGIKAKVALNSSIFILFGVAAAIAFRNVSSLKNEVLALKALQVDYGAKDKRPEDPYAAPAIVYAEPELLGAGYRLITEELSKQENLELSSGTVQTLLHDVDGRINDRKSTILYFSGLMVFLGLLGAFMGLMKTVHAVSDLIGSMDMSGKGGAESIGRMIEGMKAPLAGMSVGFSSSLFGLMTSMVLGALERCMTSAMKALRNEFEHWLSHITALEGAQQEAAANDGANFAGLSRVLTAGSAQLADMREVLAAGVDNAVQTRASINAVNYAMVDLAQAVKAVADPTPLLQPINEAVAQLARNQLDMLGAFGSLYHQAEADRAAIGAAIAALDARIARSDGLDGAQLHKQMERMLALQADVASRDPLVVNTRPIYLRPRSVGLFGWVAAVWRGVSGNQSQTGNDTREARRLRREMRILLASNQRAVQGLSKDVGARFARLEAQEGQDRATLATLTAHAKDQQAALAQIAATLHGEVPVAADKRMQTPEVVFPQVVAGGAMPAEFTGARQAMDLLKQRLRAEIEADVQSETAQLPEAVLRRGII
jgi:hypothetical protein